MKTLKIRLAKNDNGEFEFRFNDSKMAKNFHGLSSILQEGIKNGEISNGRKIVDSDYSKYIFDFHDRNELKYAQKLMRIEIRIRNEYLKEVGDSSKELDVLCITTSYIRMKNIAKILAVSLAAVTFLSFTGEKIVERIKNPLGTNNDNNNNNSYQDKNYENEIEKYYQSLKEKADAGDEKAKLQYEKYLMYQQLNEAYEDINSTGEKTR